ncbi:MAG: dihydropteroate synthase [Actinobacteria bacterium]|nr:dihydropteroate synthase [Actinomycetota bacterium]
MPPLIMGVVNVTPDSFSDGGCWPDPDSAIVHARELVAAGADIIDVGGESTRPGAAPVGPEVEAARVVPVIEALSGDVRVSVDTMTPEVAELAVAAGATIVNDVSGSFELARVAARNGCVWVCMHMQGTPRTMQERPHYVDVVAEVHDFLVERARIGLALGVPEVWIDPGIGFGKTTDHNLSLLKHLDVLVATGYPVVVGTSRKSSLGRLTAQADGSSVPDGAPGAQAARTLAAPVAERLEASIATAVWSWRRGARVVRVHDVAETVTARVTIESAA